MYLSFFSNYQKYPHGSTDNLLIVKRHINININSIIIFIINMITSILFKFGNIKVIFYGNI